MSENITAPEERNVQPVRIVEQLKTSFINYAMSVITDRALPNVCDGLKPVHRRSLFAMYGLKNFYNSPTKKSARIVGEVIGKYHPHGDIAVYETIVRMAQPFSLRYPLIEGQGNFGNIDGDSAAHMRYTEVRMTRLAGEMIADLEKNTVDSSPNYDNSLTIPDVLPNKFPNLLVNGASGIAVGMATNIPTHNMTEVIDATIALINNPSISIEGLMHYIPGPDFPTGGILYGTRGIYDAYTTGNGRVIIRAKTHIEGEAGEKQYIVIDEIPYNVRKKDLVEKINECIREKIIEGMTEVNDYSGRGNPVRVVIGLRRNEAPEIVLNKLFKHTAMQSSFPINMLALVGTHPEVLNLKQILEHFVRHRREVVTRRVVYDLARAREKAHRLEGYAVALNNIDEIISLIRSSRSRDEAYQRLIGKGWPYGMLNQLIERAEDGSELCRPDAVDGNVFGCHDGLYYLSDSQTEAILSLQLHRLTGMEYDKIVEDYKVTATQIREFLWILRDENKLLSIIKEELEYIKTTYGDARRSVIVQNTSEISMEDLIENKPVVITLSHEGYVKYQPVDEYRAQSRGGRGRLSAKMKDEDFIENMYVVNTHDTALFFTSKGRVFALKVYNLPEAVGNTKGRPIVNMLALDKDEYVRTVLPVNEFDPKRYLVFATEKGYVKKTQLSLYKNISVKGNRAIVGIILQEGDNLVNVAISSGHDDMAIFTSDGFGILFNEYYPLFTSTDVETAITTDSDDTEVEEAEVIEAEVIEDNVDEACEAIDSDDSTEEKVVVGSGAIGLRPSGRNSRGVRGIKLHAGAKVVSMLVLDKNYTDLLFAFARGYGKRVLLTDFKIGNTRARSGNKVIGRLDRNGNLIGVVQVNDTDGVIMINDSGNLVRIKVDGIPRYSRSAQGVKLVKLNNDVTLVNLARVVEKDEEADVAVDGTETENVVVPSADEAISNDTTLDVTNDDVTFDSDDAMDNVSSSDDEV